MKTPSFRGFPNEAQPWTLRSFMRWRCEDCRRESTDDEAGWIAIVLEKDPQTGKRVVLIYCPDCAKQFEDYGTSLSPTDL